MGYLLIGVNCPAALRPKQAVKEANNGRFAPKTVLGWCIIGPISKYKHSHKVVRSYKILVKDKPKGHTASHHFVVETSSTEIDCKQILLDIYEQELSELSPKKMKNKMQPGYANGYFSSSKEIASIVKRR